MEKSSHDGSNRHFSKTQSENYCRFFIENDGGEEAITSRINSRLADAAFVSLRQGLKKSPQIIDGQTRYVEYIMHQLHLDAPLSIYPCIDVSSVSETNLRLSFFIFRNSMLYVMNFFSTRFQSYV